MLIDIVYFDPDGDGVTAIYVNNQLNFFGGEYHEKISVFVAGFLNGLALVDAGAIVCRYSLGDDHPLSKEVTEDGKIPPAYFTELPRDIKFLG
jgi:hypothetical protein